MKTAGIWFALFSAIMSLLAFQAIWLNNVYKIEKKEIHEKINKILIKSIEKELNIRSQYFSIADSLIFDTDIQLDPSKRNLVLDSDEIIEAGILQQTLKFSGFVFNFNTLDSIFQSELQEKGMPFNYYLSYKDSTKAIIEQTDNLALSTKSNAFYSDSRLIVGGKRVQAIVDISPSEIFKQMFGLLFASFIMFALIVFCVFYQAKTIFSQLKLSRLREDFTHALTHDMKTPLGTINTVLSNFRSGLLDNHPDLQEKMGKTAMDQVDSLLSLVERILTIAKLEKVKKAINRTETDMYAIIKEIEDRFAFSSKKHVSINSSVNLDESEYVFIDSTLIKDAINNLVENAIKYSGESVTIDINCYKLNEQLYISVKDNGFGISDKNKKNIFEKFEWGAATGKMGASGFGIGLSHVNRVAEAHGGIVTLFSIEGDGSEFSIILPLSETK